MTTRADDILRAAIAAFNAGDEEGFAGCFATAAEIRPLRHPVDGTLFRGDGAALHYYAAVIDAWEDIRWEPEEYRELPGGGSALMLGWVRGCGRETGTPIDTRGGVVVDCEDGVIVRMQVFSSRDAALAVAGLSE